MRALSRATGLVEGNIDPAIKEMRDKIIEFYRAGRAIKVEGLGTWTSSIALDSSLDIQYRPDAAFNHGLNIPGIFSGTILNHDQIGRTADELVQRWNEEHPDDPVTFSEN